MPTILPLRIGGHASLCPPYKKPCHPELVSGSKEPRSAQDSDPDIRQDDNITQTTLLPPPHSNSTHNDHRSFLFLSLQDNDANSDRILGGRIF